MNMHGCGELRELLSQRTLQTADPEKAALLENHLEGCRPCTQEAAALDQFAGKLRVVLGKHRPAARETRLRRRFRWEALAPAAACLLCIVSIALYFRAGRRDVSPVHLPTSPTYTIQIEGTVEGMVLRDVNGDGYPDLLVAVSRDGKPGKSLIFLSDRGRFGPSSWAPAEPGSGAGVALGDLDADGTDDLVLAHLNRESILAFRGKRSGGFETAPFWRSADTEEARDLLVGDFNGDGYPDLLAGNRIYFGSKVGLNPSCGWRMDEYSHSVVRMVVADIDGDGRKDLVICNGNGNPAFEVFRGTKEGFESIPQMAAAVRGDFSALAVGDLRGDGFPDVVVGSPTSRGGDGRVRMYANRNGRLTPDPVWMSADVDCNVADLLLADLDGDGRPDLLVLAGDHTSIYLNKNGVLSPQPAWRASVPGRRALVADLDKNGFQDLVVANGSEIRFYMGGDEAAPEAAAPFPPIPSVSPLRAADLRPDLDPEIESLLELYRNAATDEARRKSLDSLRPHATAVLGALETIQDPAFNAVRRELGPMAEETLHRLIQWLGSDSPAERDLADSGIGKCGAFALSALDKAAESILPEIAARANSLRERIQGDLDRRSPNAQEVLGFKLARLTERLRRRYGLPSSVQGVVILEMPEGIAPGLGLANMREGDVILGIGPRDEDGGKVDAVKSSAEFVASLGFHGFSSEYDFGVCYLYRCGPRHPTEKDQVRKGRMSWDRNQWESIQEALNHPVTYRPHP